jgi:hypothetical protein
MVCQACWWCGRWRDERRGRLGTVYWAAALSSVLATAAPFVSGACQRLRTTPLACRQTPISPMKAFAPQASYSRVLSTDMLDVLNEDFVAAMLQFEATPWPARRPAMVPRKPSATAAAWTPLTCRSYWPTAPAPAVWRFTDQDAEDAVGNVDQPLCRTPTLPAPAGRDRHRAGAGHDLADATLIERDAPRRDCLHAGRQPCRRPVLAPCPNRVRAVSGCASAGRRRCRATWSIQRARDGAERAARRGAVEHGCAVRPGPQWSPWWRLSWSLRAAPAVWHTSGTVGGAGLRELGLLVGSGQVRICRLMGQFGSG